MNLDGPGPRYRLCACGVTRRGELDACGKIAVGWLRPSEYEAEDFGSREPYPACAWHLNARHWLAVPLTY